MTWATFLTMSCSEIGSIDISLLLFLLHDTMLLLYMLWPCVRLCLSQVGVLLKWLNIGSHKENHTRDSSFLTPKISTKFDRGHPPWGRQMQVGWVKIGDFQQIAGYISKTVQRRCMVSIKVE